MTSRYRSSESGNSLSPRRRTVVKAAAATAVLGVPVAAALPARAATDTPAFLHGVASGDPLPDGVLLWTRVTPTAEALPGSGTGPDTEVGWVIARDKALTDIVAKGSVTAAAASDHTVKADVRGLAPATDYWFRFSAGGTDSPVARTRTAPAAGATVPGLRFGVVSCANWEAGYFSAYRHLAARGDLDAWLHLGDYIYEYKSGEYGTRGTVVRPHSPANEIITLADYRVRHARYKTDPDLQALHHKAPVIAIWDDHEFADNAWSGGAVNHTEGAEGTWTARKAAANQAYFEWMPVRPAVEGTTYRRLRFGRLADLSLLPAVLPLAAGVHGERFGRRPEPHHHGTRAARLAEGGSEVLGHHLAAGRQLGDDLALRRRLAHRRPAQAAGEAAGLPQGASRSTPPVGRLHGRPPGTPRPPAGQRHPQHGLPDRRHPHGVGQRHTRRRRYISAVPSAGTEFVVTSVTSDNLDDIVKVPEGTVSALASPVIRAANRHVQWVDTDRHGYGVLDITAERAQMDYYVLSDRTNPNATSSWARSYRTRSGTQKVERTYDPV